MKRLSLLALVSVIAVAALTAGCGGSSTTTVIAPTSAATNTAAEGASAQDELIASQLAATNGGALLATVCSSIQNVGRANAERIGAKVLGPLIIKRGGSVENVVGVLLDKC
jgi:hypothetical protein